MYEVHHYPSSNLNSEHGCIKEMRGQLTKANLGLTNKVPEHGHIHELLDLLLKSLFSQIYMFQNTGFFFFNFRGLV